MCITWNAAGEGKARGRIRACSLDDEEREEFSKRGIEKHCDARTIECYEGNNTVHSGKTLKIHQQAHKLGM